MTDIERDAKVGVRSGRKAMGRLTLPSENAGRTDESSSKRTLRKKVVDRRSLSEQVRDDLENADVETVEGV